MQHESLALSHGDAAHRKRISLSHCHPSQALPHSSGPWQVQCTLHPPFPASCLSHVSFHPLTGYPHLLPHPPDVCGLLPAPRWGCEPGPCLVPIPLGDRGGVPRLGRVHSHEEGMGGTWPFPQLSWENPWHPLNLSGLSQFQDPAAVQLWAFLFFLQVLKAHEKQRRKESSPVKVSSALGCLGPQCCGTVSGVLC